MENEDNRIALDLSTLKEGHEYDLPFSLTDKEKGYFPNLLSLGDTSFVLMVQSLGTISSFVLKGVGVLLLQDAHNLEERNYSFSDSVEITIQSSDEENSDILPDSDGLYDFRGAILALLFNAIPQNYSEVPLTKIEHENYVLMSEDEYEKEKKARSNAFSALDDID